MKRLILVVSMAAFSIVGIAQESEQPREYDPHKLVKLQAENTCMVLASVSLHPSDYAALAIHIEPKTKGIIFPDREGYHVATVYPYRADGVSFACIFRDYRNNGLIQLVEFGEYGKDVEKFTTVKPLF